MPEVTELPRPTLAVKDLSLGLADGTPLVQNASFDIARSEVLALVGESGSGKTLIGRTILRLLPGAIHVRGGRILFDGRNVLEMGAGELRQLRGGSVGMIFQEPLTSLNPAMRIGRQMAEAMRLHTDLDAREIRRRSLEMLERIQVPDPQGALKAHPHEFSGGMRQRIMLAAVMMTKPALLVADEPTTALDTLSQREVLDVMIELTHDTGTSILLVTHDLGLVGQYADRAVVLEKGRVVESGPAERILTAPQQVYTRALVDAVPSLGDRTPPPVDAPAVLEAEGLRLTFDRGVGWLSGKRPKLALKGVDLTVREGEIVAVVGGSGSGKTTLGRTVLRLVDVDAGTIRYRGRDITRERQSSLGAFRRKCQIVFQDPYSSLDPRMRIGAIVDEALRHVPPPDPRRARSARRASVGGCGPAGSRPTLSA